MKASRDQGGMSVPGILGILAMLGFFAMCAIRMTPLYFEYLSVQSIISGLIMEPGLGEFSATKIRRKIDQRFNTDQIYALGSKDVKILRRKGEVFLDSSYEVRIPIMWRIDAVMKFDDLHYKLGDPTAMKAMLPAKKK
ncbi:MAG: hypothetical protein ACI9JM_001409 [Halioglobus sp.]|jgi:hypothetical protein